MKSERWSVNRGCSRRGERKRDLVGGEEGSASEVIGKGEKRFVREKNDRRQTPKDSTGWYELGQRRKPLVEVVEARAAETCALAPGSHGRQGTPLTEPPSVQRNAVSAILLAFLVR